MKWNTLDGTPTRVIAHRGASGHRPEHTMEGYRLAIAHGADVIEPDLVITRDRVLLARHDRGLARSTDVATRAEFASRKRVLANGGSDWWVDDFHWDEIQTLRAIQPYPGRSREFDGQLAIVRFGDVVELAAAESRRLGRTIGVYPEIKHPALFSALGLDPTTVLIDQLRAMGIGGRESQIWFQCFETEPLDRVQAELGLSCFFLLEPEAALGAAVSDQLRRFRELGRTGIALPKNALFDQRGRDRGLCSAAHAQGLAVHVWTFRDDADTAPFDTPAQEYAAFYALGIDALFSDFPDSALAARAVLR